MGIEVYYRACPHCGRRPFIFSFPIYRCPACMTLFCEQCADKGWFHVACPKCGGRARWTPYAHTTGF